MASLPFFDPTRPPPPFPPPAPAASVIDPFCDQKIVQEFLSTKQRPTSCTALAKEQPSAESISKLRSELIDLVKEVERLKTQKETLEKEIELQPDSQWQTSFAQLEQTKQSIASKLARLNDSELRKELRKKLHVRRKKREWQKRRGSRLKQERAEAMQNRTKLHEQIDQWQREQRKLLEKEKQAQLELDFAGHFLADVHRRKAACKRYLAKFQKMKDREPSAEFSELAQSWTAQLSECVKEEKRLKDVLARRSAGNYQRRVENEWNKALFGDTIPKKFELAKARATILEIVGDIPDVDIAPPENVLFVCKLNPVTSDDDLQIIFSRFGKIKGCEVIRDKVSGDSLQYAFIEFEDKKSCEDAYFKMDNVLIDDRRIHVDFSQSVAKVRWRGKGKGIEFLDGSDKKSFKDIDYKDTRKGRKRAPSRLRKSVSSGSRSSRSLSRSPRRGRQTGGGRGGGRRGRSPWRRNSGGRRGRDNRDKHDKRVQLEDSNAFHHEERNGRDIRVVQGKLDYKNRPYPTSFIKRNATGGGGGGGRAAGGGGGRRRSRSPIRNRPQRRSRSPRDRRRSSRSRSRSRSPSTSYRRKPSESPDRFSRRDRDRSPAERRSWRSRSPLRRRSRSPERSSRTRRDSSPPSRRHQSPLPRSKPVPPSDRHGSQKAKKKHYSSHSSELDSPGGGSSSDERSKKKSSKKKSSSSRKKVQEEQEVFVRQQQQCFGFRRRRRQKEEEEEQEQEKEEVN